MRLKPYSCVTNLASFVDIDFAVQTIYVKIIIRLILLNISHTSQMDTCGYNNLLLFFNRVFTVYSTLIIGVAFVLVV